MSEQELKPCPFCGKKPDVIEYSSYGSIHYRVQCHACGTGTRSVLAKARLSILWNTRHSDPMLEELAEKVADHYCNDELLKEMAGALEKAKEYLDEYRPHGHVLDQIEQALQKYQQSKVQP